MKKFIVNLLKNNFGGKRMQSFYELLFFISLKGMNYGNGGDFKNSGELKVLKHIKETLGEKTLTIFDVGANVGDYSKSLADFFKINTIIHSFEPSKKTFERLLKNTSGIPNIIPNNFGFGDTESSLLLYTLKSAKSY